MGVNAARERSIRANLAEWRKRCWTDLLRDRAAIRTEAPCLSTHTDRLVLSLLACPTALTIEVGRFAGATTHLLAQLSQFVVSIDSDLSRGDLARLAPQHIPALDAWWPGWWTLSEVAWHTIRDAGLGPRCELLRGDSRRAELWPEGPANLVFIDGGHDTGTALSDLRHGWQRLRGGGRLAIHDYDLALRDDPASGVDLAVDQWLNDLAGRFYGPFSVSGSSIVWVVKQ